ncbi:MAG: hypothetical protein J6Y93_01650 [Treponema sp.]|nr:hypothetical protein [Treponema sp.]
MKKIFIVLFSALFFINAVSAQVSVSPDDDFYKACQAWELKGLVKNLPPLRPYPLSVLNDILEDVINSSSHPDAELALEYWEKIFKKSYSVYLKTGGNLKVTQNTENNDTSTVKNVTVNAGIGGEHSFSELVSVGYDLGFYGETKPFSEYCSYAENKMYDSLWDASTIGPVELYLDWNMLAAVGTSSLYAQAGVSRTGFGPFIDDGLALNDTSFHSANLAFNVVRDKWSYASVYESIGSTKNYDNSKTEIGGDKFLAFHALKYNFTRYFSLSYYENILFGPQSSIAYLFPAPYMAVQNITGANANLQMGLLFEFKPVRGLLWATDIFVDDIEVDEVVKLNFDCKLRFAVQTGFIFAPSNFFCNRMSVHYTCILPYVYSHWEYDGTKTAAVSGDSLNYQNYTNAGVHIGSALDPNSDRVSFNARFYPAKRFTVDVITSFVRHANSSEAMDYEDVYKYVTSDNGQYMTNGSVYQHQMFSAPSKAEGEHVSQAWDCLGFMTSEHKMYVCQAGFGLSYELPKTKAGTLSLNFGYTFEYVHNRGVDKNIYTGCGQVVNESGEYKLTYNGTEYTADSEKAVVKAVASKQKQEWIDSLTDCVNQYVSFSVKYCY